MREVYKVVARMKSKTSNWKGVDICNKCFGSVSLHDQVSNGGICPKCGYNYKSTIVWCHTISYRTTTTYNGPWWKWWDKTIRFEGASDYDKEWLKK